MLGFGFQVLAGVGFMLGFGFQAWLLGLKPMGFGFRPPPVKPMKGANEVILIDARAEWPWMPTSRTMSSVSLLGLGGRRLTPLAPMALKKLGAVQVVLCASRASR